jgi:glycosyltransferase involved in cell wall biosynthesis
MDGLEWKRSKYSKVVQKFLIYAERLAVKYSDYLISDSVGIQTYLRNKYSVDSEYIPYGANLISDIDDSILKKHNLTEGSYNMLIARLEPENNIETILQSVVESETERNFLVIGNTENKYGQYIKQKFKDDRIIYLGYVSGIEKLDALRKNSNIYFHGHTVGGTNPSLLEAMSSHALICAHNNEFNRAILGKDAFYFSCKKCIIPLLNQNEMNKTDDFISNNLEKIKQKYSWRKVISDYESYMISKLKE